MKTKNICSVLFFLLSLSAKAMPLDGFFGVANIFSSVPNASTDARAQFRLGGLTEVPFLNGFRFKVGAGFSQRGTSLTNSGLTVTVDRSYLDFPVLVAYEQDFQLFAGVSVSKNIGSKCRVSDSSMACSNDDSKAVVVQPVMGFQSPEYKSLRMILYYEFPSEYQKNWDQYALGVNLLYRIVE